MNFLKKISQVLAEIDQISEINDDNERVEKKIDSLISIVSVIATQVAKLIEPTSTIPTDSNPTNPGPVTPGPVTSGDLYVPHTQLSTYLDNNKKDPNFDKLQKVALQSTAIWLNGAEDPANQNAAIVKRVTDILKDAKGKLVVFATYIAVGRDGGGWSKGGFKTQKEVNDYLGAIGYAIQQAGNPPVVIILDPDSLALNLPSAYDLNNAAVDILKKNSNTKVFIDASHPNWVPAREMSGRVKGAGVERADGISVNVSNRYPTADCEAYAIQVLQGLQGGLQYIVDVSRNGAKVDTTDYDNVPGTKIGQNPKIMNKGQLFAYLWVKPPGESDAPTKGWPNPGDLYLPGLLDMLN